MYIARKLVDLELAGFESRFPDHLERLRHRFQLGHRDPVDILNAAGRRVYRAMKKRGKTRDAWLAGGARRDALIRIVLATAAATLCRDERRLADCLHDLARAQAGETAILRDPFVCADAPVIVQRVFAEIREDPQARLAFQVIAARRPVSHFIWRHGLPASELSKHLAVGLPRVVAAAERVLALQGRDAIRELMMALSACRRLIRCGSLYSGPLGWGDTHVHTTG